ncbi:hypothetical protein E2C01_085687 [Portunus trituberculatus]|uniref:Uncharacterized protein n=1 Tax=Portunus trituberculatus TaxID=210409 RepID=A0A5B7J1P4_PORTR|nr:hypothetical protein [Portunus trituberculatus]
MLNLTPHGSTQDAPLPPKATPMTPLPRLPVYSSLRRHCGFADDYSDEMLVFLSGTNRGI